MSTNYRSALLLNPEFSSANENWGRARLGSLVSEMEKKGKKVMSLAGGIAETVEDGKLVYAGPPEWISDEVCEGLKNNRDYGKNQAEVKRLIAEWYKEEYELEIDSDSEITICPGTSFVCDACPRMMAGPGDEVLIMDPDYVTYMPQVASTGARVVPVPLKEKQGEWCFDIEELEKRVTPMSKLLMMSNANNPSGFFYTKEDLKEIAKLAERHGFMVFHDQVAEEFVLDRDKGYKLNCLASLQGMKEHTIIGSSFSKIYNIAFWRTGWAVANRDFCEGIKQLIMWVNDGNVKPGIDAMFAILRQENRKEREKWVSQTLSQLRKKRDYMKKRLGEIEGVIPNTCRGHYWAWPNVSAFGKSSMELAEYLLKKAELYVRPGTWYGKNGEGHFRLSFNVPFEYLNESLDRMQQALEKLPTKT